MTSTFRNGLEVTHDGVATTHSPESAERDGEVRDKTGGHYDFARLVRYPVGYAADPRVERVRCDISVAKPLFPRLLLR